VGLRRGGGAVGGRKKMREEVGEEGGKAEVRLGRERRSGKGGGGRVVSW